MLHSLSLSFKVWFPAKVRCRSSLRFGPNSLSLGSLWNYICTCFSQSHSCTMSKKDRCNPLITNWFAVKELSLSHCIGETRLFTRRTHDGNLI